MLIGSSQHFVMAGEIVVVNSELLLRTTLGSCISVIAWLPNSTVGGMCHYLLPSVSSPSVQKPDYYYGDLALKEMAEQLEAYAPLHNYQYWLAGGGDMLTNKEATSQKPRIASQNTRLAHNWANDHAIVFSGDYTGGPICRTATLNTSIGSLNVKTYPI